jgi:hypothetical protein
MRTDPDRLRLLTVSRAGGVIRSDACCGSASPPTRRKRSNAQLPPAGGESRALGQPFRERCARNASAVGSQYPRHPTPTFHEHERVRLRDAVGAEHFNNQRITLQLVDPENYIGCRLLGFYLHRDYVTCPLVESGLQAMCAGRHAGQHEGAISPRHRKERSLNLAYSHASHRTLVAVDDAAADDATAKFDDDLDLRSIDDHIRLIRSNPVFDRPPRDAPVARP